MYGHFAEEKILCVFKVSFYITMFVESSCKKINHRLKGNM